jgi:CheY-like chemotaxis protein
VTERMQKLLDSTQITQLEAIKKHAITLLENTPRFKYFTLHGEKHIENLFKIVDLLLNNGLELNREQAFLLACSICIHDIGMVVPLNAMDQNALLWGKPQPADPANIELLIRTIHHELIDQYIDRHYDFLFGIGLSPTQCALLKDISKCHRKIEIDDTHGYIRSLGALLRIIDELDISPSRAPAAILTEHYDEMDATSCWHWFKHNICQDWLIGHNVVVETSGLPRVTFLLAVHPPNGSAIPYWLTQVRRPIQRVFFDEGAARVVSECLGLQILLKTSQELSSPVKLGLKWNKIQEKALSAGRKVILVIDDEVRKLEDLFLPLMQTYHVIFSPNAKDALDKLAAIPVNFVVVDLQVGTGFQWSAEETDDFKMTGVRLCQEIKQNYPMTKIGILTGSRHDLSEVQHLDFIEFLLRKPVDPDTFEKEVDRVLTRAGNSSF